LIELDDLVPVFGLVERLTLVEPRGRHERPVLALIRPLHALLGLEGSAAPEHVAAGTLKAAADALPRARQIGVAVGQPRRRRVGIRGRGRAELRRHGRGEKTEDRQTADEAGLKTGGYVRLHRTPHFPPAFRTLSG